MLTKLEFTGFVGFSFFCWGLTEEISTSELQERYPAMYDNIDMDEVAGGVIGAIRQRDSKQSSELI